MKTFLFLIILFFACSGIAFAQSMPSDSLYLGQIPPGSVPKVFPVAVNPGSFAAERIAISRDGKEIYYGTLQKYYPAAGDTIRCYRYTGNGWTGPFNLFNGYLAPCLSRTGDTILIQNNNIIGETFYSVRISTGWSSPARFLKGLNSAHYVQETDSGHFYASSIPSAGLGGNDWCRLYFNASDTTAGCIGQPVSSALDNLDFFIARDESYMILAQKDLKVTYRKPDGSWTNPQNLGPAINFGLAGWGPYVSPDNKYLFYTTGTKPDYSDVHIYWVRVDDLIGKLRTTGMVPDRK